MNDVALDDFYQDQVDAYIDSIDVPEGAREPFLVDCDGKADWCLRKILPHQKRIDAIQRQAKERIRIVKAWEADETLRHSSEITRFEAFLYPYVTEQLKGSKNKTFARQTPKRPKQPIGFRSSARIAALTDPATSSGVRMKKWRQYKW